jgi:hypothetical protein
MKICRRTRFRLLKEHQFTPTVYLLIRVGTEERLKAYKGLVGMGGYPYYPRARTFMNEQTIVTMYAAKWTGELTNIAVALNSPDPGIYLQERDSMFQKRCTVA